MEDVYLHIYNQGAHGAAVFTCIHDYRRMQTLLYAANDTSPLVMSALPDNVFTMERRKALVDIVAYRLSSDRFDLVIRKTPASHVSRFMQKLATSYSAYFNTRHKHSGTIWQGSYKDNVMYDRSTVRKLIASLHAIPGAGKRHEKRYSSWPEYDGERRPERGILAAKLVDAGIISDA